MEAFSDDSLDLMVRTLPLLLLPIDFCCFCWSIARMATASPRHYQILLPMVISIAQCIFSVFMIKSVRIQDWMARIHLVSKGACILVLVAFFFFATFVTNNFYADGALYLFVMSALQVLWTMYAGQLLKRRVKPLVDTGRVQQSPYYPQLSFLANLNFLTSALLIPLFLGVTFGFSLEYDRVKPDPRSVSLVAYTLFMFPTTTLIAFLTDRKTDSFHIAISGALVGTHVVLVAGVWMLHLDPHTILGPATIFHLLVTLTWAGLASYIRWTGKCFGSSLSFAEVYSPLTEDTENQINSSQENEAASSRQGSEQVGIEMEQRSEDSTEDHDIVELDEANSSIEKEVSELNDDYSHEKIVTLKTLSVFALVGCFISSILSIADVVKSGRGFLCYTVPIISLIPLVLVVVSFIPRIRTRKQFTLLTIMCPLLVLLVAATTSASVGIYATTLNFITSIVFPISWSCAFAWSVLVASEETMQSTWVFSIFY